MESSNPRPDDRIALWVGPEPTVNRVRQQFMDQLEATGFAHRLEDLDRLASLGAERVRFPVLWERLAPERPGLIDWTWSDLRMERLRELRLQPIVGLVHHGSGPRYTDLLDPWFAMGLADYATRVAERYPWADAWTPVNEPVTTARFCGLYALWYPHLRSDAGFVRALLNQMRGVRLAMRAIRAVNPSARLVQTDDVGYVSSTRRLRYQADFENERRWLSFDLLLGRVRPGHSLWGYLRRHGASEAELMEFVESPCPADVIGVNAYITSERFLDHRLQRYPSELHGGNGEDRYVDLEAVRVRGRHIGGFQARLREVHARYGGAMAITEAHLGCTREEQMRWLLEAWNAARQARREGIDVRAVTAWSAFGSSDWASLVTRNDGRYEPGLWDCRSSSPRPTALAGLAAQLARGAAPAHPLLLVPGWWKRHGRLEYPAHGRLRGRRTTGHPLLIVGATGTLGRAFARICRDRGIPFRLLGRADMDIADVESVRRALREAQPWAVINTAGYVRVDEAEHDERQWRENAIGPAVLAAECALRDLRLLTFSTDLVFDGEKDLPPYLESDRPNPLNAYGRSKLAAERAVMQHFDGALVVRTAAFFGPWDEFNFVTCGLASVRRGEPWRAAHDQRVSPTYVPDLVHASLDLLIDGENGVWHLANRGATSWAELAAWTVDAAGLDRSLVVPVPGASLGYRAPRPRNVALASERGSLMPTLEHAIESYLNEVVARPQHAGIDHGPAVNAAHAVTPLAA
ncbi:MAG TPA: sugar nucleotide-binding protein [Burkholderiaceae bacterium]|nr:sugar nucleotide-binding protein [Burkholderiaceae bacterium]